MSEIECWRHQTRIVHAENGASLDLEQDKAKQGNWKPCAFIVGTEFCERLAYYGIQTNLVTYLHKGFNMSSAAASNSVNNWSGTCFLTPLIGAYVADSFLGKFRTISMFSVIYLIGMVLLSLSTMIPALKPPFCKDEDGRCPSAKAQLGVCFVSLYLIALGTGGIKACVVAFGADQFAENDEKQMKLKSSFFNWFYFVINIGSLLSSSVLVYVQENVGWAWGDGISAMCFLVALCCFFGGSRSYHHEKPCGSAFTWIAQVLVASLRKWRVEIPQDSSLLHELDDEFPRELQHTENFRFLDKAAVKTGKNENEYQNPWHLATVTQVEELKMLIRLLPIWISGLVMNCVFNQTATLFILQGQNMSRHMGPHFSVPAASLITVDTLSVLFCIPVYDQVIVPLVSKYSGHPRGFTDLQRIGIGMIVSILGIMAAAMVEMRRLAIFSKYSLHLTAEVPMSIFWQVPQYFLLGAAEVLSNIGTLELFYDQVPDSMRSIGTALSYASIALGNYLSSAIVSIVGYLTTSHGKAGWITKNLNDGHLDYFFWLLSLLSIVNFIFFLLVSKFYQYKKTNRGT